MASCGIDTGFEYPSDPSNNSVLSATATFGGIRVSWTYPNVNPQSVTHIKLFKSTSSSFGTAGQIATVSGDSFVDGAVVNGTTYYYWIQIVSINGTTGATIGPASATAVGQTEQIVGLLTAGGGQIDISALAGALSSEIAKIETNRTSILDEGVIRSGLVEGLELDLAAYGIDVTNNFSAIVNEQTQRIDGDNVLAASVSAVIASNVANFAAITQEQVALVSADSALAGVIQTIEASVLVIDGDVDALEADVANQPVLIEAAIQEYDVAQVGYCQLSTGDISTDVAHKTKSGCEGAGHTWLELNALATAIKTVQIDDGQGGTSTIEVFSQAVDTRQSAIEGDVTTLDGNVTSLDSAVSTAQGDITAAEGDITQAQSDIGGLEAQYTIKLQTTNDNTSIVGGFGLASTTSGSAATISAGFNVDEFWIADLSDDVESAPGVIKPEFIPFYIVDNQVHIQDAVIKNLTVGTIKFEDNAVSGFDETVYSTDAVFTNYSGYAAPPPAFSFDTPEVGNSFGFVPTRIRLSMDYQLTKDAAWSSFIGFSSPVYIKRRSRTLPSGSFGSWTTYQLGDIYSCTGSAAVAVWGGSFSYSILSSLVQNREYEYKLSEDKLGPLTDGITSSYFTGGRVTHHVWSAEAFAK